MREGSPRIVFATALMRAAFAGDLELVKLLLAHGADRHIQSSDRETTLMAACGLAFINGYHRQKPPAERLEVVKLMVDLGEDVNHADSYGITPLMAAANLGDINIVRAAEQIRPASPVTTMKITPATSSPRTSRRPFPMQCDA